MLRQLIASSAFAVLAIGGRIALPVRGDPPLGAADLERREYEVYSDPLATRLRGVRFVADSTERFYASPCTGDEGRYSNCIKAPAETSVEAWQEFAARNRESVALTRSGFADSLQLQLRGSVRADPTATCRSPRLVHFSRVGFSADGSQAVLSYSDVVGRGPYPGCGYVTGNIVVVERRAGVWAVVRLAGGFIT
jgi:hypothetical protein